MVYCPDAPMRQAKTPRMFDKISGILLTGKSAEGIRSGNCERPESMKQEVYVERTEVATAPSLTRRVSWGAIFAGFFVTMVVQLTLTLLGTAFGAASLDSMRDHQNGQKMAIASGVWLLATGLVSIWVGACVAGRLSGGPRRADGLIHGIVTWSVSTCATLALLATTLGAIIGGTGALLGGALALGGLTGGGNNEAPLQEQVKNLFPQAGPLLPPTGRTEQGAQPPGKLTELSQKDPQLAAALAEMEKKGGAAQASEERDKAVSLLTAQYNMDQQQAGNLVQQWDQEYQHARGQTEQKAGEVANAATRGVASGALWGFVALALGLIFAAWGGWVGTASLPAYVETVGTTA